MSQPLCARYESRTDTELTTLLLHHSGGKRAAKLLSNLMSEKPAYRESIVMYRSACEFLFPAGTDNVALKAWLQLGHACESEDEDDLWVPGDEEAIHDSASGGFFNFDLDAANERLAEARNVTQDSAQYIAPSPQKRARTSTAGGTVAAAEEAGTSAADGTGAVAGGAGANTVEHDRRRELTAAAAENRIRSGSMHSSE